MIWTRAGFSVGGLCAPGARSMACLVFLTPAHLLGDTSALWCHHSTSAVGRELAEPRDTFVSYPSTSTDRTVQGEHVSHRAAPGNASLQLVRPPSTPSSLAWRLNLWGAVLFAQSIICSNCSRDKLPPLRMPGSEALAVRSCSGAVCFGQLLHLGRRKDRPSFCMESVLFRTSANTKACRIPGTCQLGFLEPACTGSFFKNIAASHLVCFQNEFSLLAPVKLNTTYKILSRSSYGMQLKKKWHFNNYLYAPEISHQYEEQIIHSHYSKHSAASGTAGASSIPGTQTSVYPCTQPVVIYQLFMQHLVMNVFNL